MLIQVVVQKRNLSVQFKTSNFIHENDNGVRQPLSNDRHESDVDSWSCWNYFSSLFLYFIIKIKTVSDKFQYEAYPKQNQNMDENEKYI